MKKLFGLLLISAFLLAPVMASAQDAKPAEKAKTCCKKEKECCKKDKECSSKEKACCKKDKACSKKETK
jgi:hypothetical protein